MNILDIIIAIILVIAAVMGYRRGVIEQVCSLAGILLGIYLAFKFSNALGDWLNIGERFTPIVNFVIILIVVIIILILIGKLFRKVFHMTGLGIVDRLGGLALSVLKIGLLLSLFLGFLVDFNKNIKIANEDFFEESVLLGGLRKMSDIVFPYIVDAKEAIFDSVKNDAGDTSEHNGKYKTDNI